MKTENQGRFAKVTHVQRVDTWAGRPPAAAPVKAGDVQEVPYQATYILWGESPVR